MFHQDELSAVTMQKKHQIVEQAVEDYAETVHQLSKTSRGLVADGHPERCSDMFLSLRLSPPFIPLRATESQISSCII